MKKIAKPLLATLLFVTLLASLPEAKTVLPTLFNAKSVFEYGNFLTTNISVKTTSSNSASSPPKPVIIVSPTVSGKYPVIQFHHGFEISSSDYTDLFNFISSHGYIVVAPQLYPIDWIPSSGPDELNSAVEVANWLPSCLSSVLPENVKPDLTKLTISGHSRGGKVAFAVALGEAKTPLQVQFSAVMGIDPVEGTQPKILTNEPDSFNLSVPVGVVGTGLGSERNWLSPPCAPSGNNHIEFFNECKAPCDHFGTTDYGHMDMLNDQVSGIIANAALLACKGNGGSKDAVRRTIGGIFIAFLQAYLDNEWDNYTKIIYDPSIAPVTLNPVESKAQNEAFVV